jgi:hypothetical protein
VIVSVVGNVGEGKTLFLTFIGMLELDEGKGVYSTFHIDYESAGGNRARYVDIGELSLWLSREEKIGTYAPDSASVLLDEGYAGMDARSSQSIANKQLSYFVFQSRKLGLNLWVASQLFSSLDKRLRGVTQGWILCEKEQRLMDDGITNVEDFHYLFAGPKGPGGDFTMPYEVARDVFPHFSTMEIVPPPMIALDKGVAKAARKLIVERQINQRRTVSKSEITTLLKVRGKRER